MNNNIFAFDLGTTTGWAVRSDDVIQFGSNNFSPKRGEGCGIRFLRFRQWLNRLLETNTKPDVILYEVVMAHKGADAAHIYGGFQAILTECCELNSIPYQGIPVGTIKKRFTGKGNANKEAMIAEAKQRGFDVKDDNAADAVAILLCGMID